MIIWFFGIVNVYQCFCTINILFDEVDRGLGHVCMYILLETISNFFYSYCKFPLIYRGVGILKNHRSWDQDFLVKIRGRGSGLGKYSFSLIMYGFCSSNALYSRSVSLRMFILILLPFDIICYFGIFAKSGGLEQKDKKGVACRIGGGSNLLDTMFLKNCYGWLKLTSYSCIRREQILYRKNDATVVDGSTF